MHAFQILDQSYLGSLGFQLRSAFGIDAYELTSLPLVFKFDESLDQGEQRVVFAAADVIAGFPFCSALPGDDIAAENVLAAEFLESEPLSVRVAAIPG